MQQQNSEFGSKLNLVARLAELEKRLDKQDVRLQLSEDLLRLKKKQVSDQQESDDARYRLVYDRLIKLEHLATSMQETHITLEQRLQDKIVEMQKVTLQTLCQVDKSFQTSKEELRTTLFSTLQEDLSSSLQQVLHVSLERSLERSLSKSLAASLTAGLTTKLQAMVQEQVQSVVPQIQNKLSERMSAVEIECSKQNELLKDRLNLASDKVQGLEATAQLQQHHMQTIQGDVKTQQKLSKQLHHQNKHSQENVQAYIKQIRADQSTLLTMLTEMKDTMTLQAREGLKAAKEIGTVKGNFNQQLESLHGFQQVCQQLRMRQDEHQRELFQAHRQMQQSTDGVSEEVQQLKKRLLGALRFFNRVNNSSEERKSESAPFGHEFSSSGSALELTRAYEPEKSMDNLERLSQSINKKLSRSLSSFGMNNSTNSNHQPAAANDEVNISKGLMQTKDLEEEFVSSLLNSSLQPHT